MHGRGHAALAAASALIMAQAAATDASAVDGVIEINQARALAGGVTASDTPGFPVTLDAAGSYRLTGNLEMPAGTSAAIEITAEDVSVDLNGFRIACQSGVCFSGESGVVAAASVHSVSVANGRIDSMDGYGIGLPGNRNSVDRVQVLGFDTDTAIRLGDHCRITDSRMGNGQHGGSIGSHCLVRGLVASQGSNDGGLLGGDDVTVVDSEFSGHSNIQGLKLGDRASVVNVTADNNSDDGIQVGAGSTVKNCRARSNGGAGIEAVSGTIVGNTVEENGPGIQVSGSATIASNSVVGNGSTGIQVSGNATVSSNTVVGNDEGIVVGGDATVTSNTVTGNTAEGIVVGGSGTVLSNTASGNSGEGLDVLGGAGAVGYGSNVFNGNNGGNANPQVSGGTEIGQNICGGDTTCP